MIISGKRAVAYFDILGFKAKIDGMPLEDLSEKYEKLITHTNGQFTLEGEKLVSKQVCIRYIFSDSIFLIAEEDSEESFEDLITYAWRMMQIAIASGLPLRGAISYGDIYANLNRNIFLGKSITDAVILEGKQNWIGAVVEDSAIERYGTVFAEGHPSYPLLNLLLPVYCVPLKDGTQKEYHVINWRQNMASEIGIKPLFQNEPYSDAVQEKINNTLCFSKAIVDSKHAYFIDTVVPVRYRKLYVTKNPPNDNTRFINGDEY